MSERSGKGAARRGSRAAPDPRKASVPEGGDGLERLQKVLARAGAASRRGAEAMILAGRVSVDGRVVRELGTKVDPKKSRIELDGKTLASEEFVHYVLNKPAGMVTTLDDPEGRPSVGDLIQEIPERVYPVGRLDYDAEGVLIVTNDGELANRLMHPRYGVRRTYDAKVKGVPSEAVLDRLRDGVRLEDGMAKPLSVAVVGRATRNTWVRVEVAEGRPHLVKRIFDAIGHPVQRLRRVDYGGLTVDDLSPGHFRALSKNEVACLRDALEHGEASGKGPKRRPGAPSGPRPGRKGGAGPKAAGRGRGRN